MVVGILQFDLHVHDAASLKDKRRVVLSVKDRLRRGHHASVAEVGLQETWNVARLGLAVVGNDGKHIGNVLDKITAELRALHDAELGATSREILHGCEIEGRAADETDESEIAAEMRHRAEEMGEEGTR
ncbi:MAG: DUF503 domain-containing protein [Phycisphaerales bacterium]